MSELSPGSVQDQADRFVERLTKGEKAWAETSLTARADLLDEMAALTLKHAQEWVRVAAQIKQLPATSPLVGEEWISGPYSVLTSLEALAATTRRLADGNSATEGFTFKQAPGNRVAVEVLPHSTYEWLLLNGFEAEVWMEPGVTEAQARVEAGLGLLDPAATRGLTLVLGAGNIFSIAPLDTIYQLYAENRVVALKLNPVTDALLPVFTKIFKPFIDLGVVEIFSGGIEIGGVLAQHDGMTAVHMTGSEQTHDAIVWGPGEEGDRAKAAGSPVLTKDMTSELGGVSPVIIVPGKWDKADLRFQAEHVATQRLHNSGSNCIAAQIVVLSSDWPQKEEFLAELRAVMAEVPARPAWYPGSDGRVQEARDTHPGGAQAIGGSPARTLIDGLDFSNAEEPAFSQEYFAPVLGVSELPGTGAQFLRTAIDTANNTLRGTLGANIIAHPRELAALGDDFDSMIADLRYGTVAINAWTGVGYLTAHATWGAFPGHALDDIQSGVGVVHNALLLAKPERSVVRGPFRPAPRSLLKGEFALSPRPPWFVTNKTAATTGERLTNFAGKPGWGALPGIFASALRG